MKAWSGPGELVPWRGLLCAALVLALLFLALSLLAFPGYADGWWIDYPALIVTGPYSGFLAHGGRNCCREVTDALMPAAASLLALGVLAAIVPLPAAFRPRAVASVRVALWSLGWSAWFLSALLSLSHVGIR